MTLTLPTLATYLDDARRAYVDQGITLIRSSRKGSRQFGDLFTKDILVSDMLTITGRYVPVGIIVTPAVNGGAMFDLSSIVSATIPNANDIRITISRPDTPITILDTKVDKQGLTDAQWVAAIATAVTTGGSGYTASSVLISLVVTPPDGSTDTGDVVLRLYNYNTSNVNPFYSYFDWDIVVPGAIVRQYGGVLSADATEIYLLYTLDYGVGEFIGADDGKNNGISSQVGLTTLGRPSRPSVFPNSGIMYFANTNTGMITALTPSTTNETSHGVAVTPTGTKADSVYSPTTNFIYFINGANYQKINAANTVTNSTSPSIPNDDYLTLNILTGIPLSHGIGGNVMTQLADSGALTTHTLSINIAGRIAIHSTSYYVPQSAARRIYVFNTSFVATSFIDLAAISGITVTANVKDCYVFGDILYCIHTDGNVSVFDLLSGAFLNTFFTGVAAQSFFTSSNAINYLSSLAVYQAGATAAAVQTQPLQGGSPAVVWTSGDNCLIETEQIKLMGKVTRAWNINGCEGSPSGGGAPISGSATYILTSDGQQLLTSNGDTVIE